MEGVKGGGGLWKRVKEGWKGAKEGRGKRVGCKGEGRWEGS